jgi:hypothetical protein
VSDLEEALIQHLTDFLLELGDDFAFLGRQRRLRKSKISESSTRDQITGSLGGPEMWVPFTQTIGGAPQPILRKDP